MSLLAVCPLSFSFISCFFFLFSFLFISVPAFHSLRPIEPPRFLGKNSCRMVKEGCACSFRIKMECCCRGLGVNELPTNFTRSMNIIILSNTSISSIDENFFSAYPYLEEIEIYASENLTVFDSKSIRNLTNLRKFHLTWCKKLEEISGTLLEFNYGMQSLVLRENGLKRMPSLLMSDNHKFDVEVDLSGNEIEYIGDGRVKNVRARQLKLNFNRLKEIAGYAFTGSSFLRLYLNNNEDLYDLSPDAFKSIVDLHHIDLSHTSIRELPVNGLKDLKSLKLRNVPNLKRLPSVLSFTRLETAHFTYPHHCCLFKHIDDVVETESGVYKSNMREIHHRVCRQRDGDTAHPFERVPDVKRRRRQIDSLLTTTETPFFDFLSQIFAADDVVEVDEELDDDLPAFPPEMIGVSKCLNEAFDTSVRAFYLNITCSPQPDPLNPCENIVGYPFLRRAIWVSWTLAILGNGLVWITLVVAFEKRLKVHYIFMINLSIADLFTGVYLAILAVQDARYSDEYYRYAVAWQTGTGCKIAGFLAVFATKLSLISMFLIAFEMAYNTKMGFFGRQLSTKAAFILLTCGWIFSGLMASLPLFDVSAYTTTSICLPLRISSTLDKTYIVSALLFNVFSFVGMAICYFVIASVLWDPKTPTRDEDKPLIAKFALLILVDFLCWFPTIFFGLTAALGFPLISLSNAKIFLVFFFPINSVSNPFLYVFFTELIRRSLKTKAMPMIRRIASSPAVAKNTLNNFYNTQPPGRRDDMGSPTRLLVTQTTSCSSTPRGSASSNRTNGSLDGENEKINLSPRESLLDSTSMSSGYRSSSDYSRKSLPLLKKVSAIPEMSDLSEHSSGSCHEHIPSRKSSLSMRWKWMRWFGRHSGSADSGRDSISSTDTPMVEIVDGSDEIDFSPAAEGNGKNFASGERRSSLPHAAHEAANHYTKENNTKKSRMARRASHAPKLVVTDWDKHSK